MKTIPPQCPEPESGQKYWRSLDQLADSPGFRQWVEQEFPAGASEFTNPVSRRHFVQIMSASFLLAGLGLTGCRRPEEKILPFSKMPENYVHGVPQFYATSMPVRGSAMPLLVKSSDGRPTKIEGNPEHPDSNGGTDTFAQASILNLYDADRAHRFTKAGNEVSREVALDALTETAKKFATASGEGLSFLMERSSSPSRERLQKIISAKFPKARWFIYEPVDFDVHRQAASVATGKSVRPYFKLDQAKVVLSLDCDFIGAEDDTYRYCRGFAKGRKVSKPGDKMNRLYSVEALMTLTGVNADHRLRVTHSGVISVAAAIASQIDPAFKVIADKFPLPASVKPQWIVECAKDLLANPGASLILAGHRQPLAVHLLANAINGVLKNFGKTVQFLDTPEAKEGTIAELAGLLDKSQIDTLVVLGGNPVYNAPANLNWAAAQAKAKNVIRLGYYEDETWAASTWHLPMTHYLESWGDARTGDGTVVSVQPLIAPIFGGLTDLEVLARIGGLEATKPHDIVRETFKGLAGADLFEEKWKKFLHDGFLPGAGKIVDASLVADKTLGAFGSAPAPAAPSKDKLEVAFHRDYKMDDGRYNNNGWLQELPDPITKAVWDGVVLLSRETAEKFAVKNEDVVEIGFDGRTIQGPVWIQPGLADYSIGLALGYGREGKPNGGGTGRVGNNVGLYNAYRIRTTDAQHFGVGATLKKTGKTFTVACTQEHGSMEGRPIIREANLQQFEAHPRFAKNMDLEAHSEHIVKVEPNAQQKAVNGKDKLPEMIYEHPYRGFEARKSQSGIDLSKTVFESQLHQWGMSIDLSSCVGCSACVLACQSENNIPIVGKDQVHRNREMHWLRIDRYYSGTMEKGPKEQVDEPQVANQPMLCQHCENAPCESVCPVNATVHDEEGLNVMAYNRCVGTRYCSNNCPYKVRRFNFLDYNKRSLDQLKGPYYSTPLLSKTDGEWTLKRWWKNPDAPTRPEDEWELLKLLKNPDVTVRMRGVMEKCTFCVQRIEQAKIAQKIKAGQSGDVQVADGKFKTACEQACPAEAIVFGNLLDPNSRVSVLKKQERDYSVLGFLDTRPRLTYLARIRNPNKNMPDYHESPLNIQEYIDKQGSPFEEHHSGAAGHESAPHAEKKGAH